MERCLYACLLLSLLLHVVFVGSYFFVACDSRAALAVESISVSLLPDIGHKDSKPAGPSAAVAETVVTAAVGEQPTQLPAQSVPLKPQTLAIARPEAVSGKIAPLETPVITENVENTVAVKPAPAHAAPAAAELVLNVPAPVVAALPVAQSDAEGTADNAFALETGAAEATGPIRIGFNDAGGPRVLKMPRLQYPPRAKRLRKEGRVLLLLELDRFGSLAAASVVESAGFDFDAAALNAVGKATFSPAELEGQPVACLASLPIRFRLRPSR